jgi:hypothetical protein
MKLGLVSCTKSKQSHSCRAEEMYLPSALFTKAYGYARKHYDKVAILSAKYGLLLPEELIEPYELALKTMGRREKKQWAEKTFKQLNEKLNIKKNDTVFFHAGNDYREHLIPLLMGAEIKICIPLEGLSFGQQLQWYGITK